MRARLGSVLLLVLLLQACFVECTDTILADSASPDGSLSGRVELTACGVPGGSVLRVTLRAHSAWFNRSKTILTTEGPYTARLVWHSPTSLEVRVRPDGVVDDTNGRDFVEHAQTVDTWRSVQIKFVMEGGSAQ
jgi:hypothetical protein